MQSDVFDGHRIVLRHKHPILDSLMHYVAEPYLELNSFGGQSKVQNLNIGLDTKNFTEEVVIRCQCGKEYGQFMMILTSL